MILIALVATRASGSTLTLASVLAVMSLPGLTINPFAGAYVDRWDRKRTMVICDLIRAAVILGFPLIVKFSGALPMALGVFFLFSVTAFFVIARLAMIPDLVKPKDLAKANALFTSSGMIGSAVILLIGALLVEWIGVERSCWINAGSYCTSAFLIMPVVLRRQHVGRPPAALRAILKEIGEGVRELWRQPSTRLVVGMIALLTAGAGATFVIGTVLVQQMLGSITRDIGFLSLWFGVGMLAGSLIYGRWGTRLPKQAVIGLAFLGCGVAIWLFVASVLGLRSGVAASAATWVLGFWSAPVGIIANTIVHERHTAHLHGRIFSSIGVVMNVALIGAMLIAGWLGESGGRGLILAVVGGVFGLSGLTLLCYTKRR